MRDQIRGCVRIRAEGPGVYRFINGLREAGVNCGEQVCNGGVFYGEVSRREMRCVRETAEKCGVSLTAEELPTVSERLLRYRLRIGLFAGAAAVLLAAVWLSGTIFTIEVQGNERVETSVILAALEELGVKPGVRAGSIDYVLTEDRLRMKINDLAWAGMHRTGSRLVVEVTERVMPPDMLRERLPCNVVASRDAIITYTVVQDGMLMHKVGDFVPKGTLLISGVTADDTGHSTFHHAMGQITGEFEETVTFTGERVPVCTALTGRCRRRSSLELLGVRIPLYIGKNDFDSQQKDVRKRCLTFFGREIPVTVVSEELSETEVTQREMTEAELSESLMEKVYLYEKNFLSGGTEIVERRISRSADEDSMTLTVTYRLRGDICLQKDIFLA